MKKLFKKLKEKKGFTLIESVVAIAILSIASLTFAIFLATSNRMTLATINSEKEFAELQEAISTIKIYPDSSDIVNIPVGDTVYRGKIIEKTETDEKVKFVIDFGEGKTIDVEGKYFIVDNPDTGKHMVVFVPNEV